MGSRLEKNEISVNQGDNTLQPEKSPIKMDLSLIGITNVLVVLSRGNLLSTPTGTLSVKGGDPINSQSIGGASELVS